MPARPLHCRYCRGIFLPVTDLPATSVQCPHCSAIMLVGHCEAADTARPVSGQEWEPEAEPDGSAVRGAEREHRRTRRLVIGGTAGLVIAAGAVAWVLVGHDPPPSAPPAVPANSRVTEVVDPAASPEVQRETLELARQFLGAHSWEELLPLVVDRVRVRGLMEWYYATRPLQPVGSGDVRVERVETLEADGQTLRRVHAATPDRVAVWFLLRREEGVWKVDWEVFANIAVERWRAFVKEPAGSSVELPILVALKPAGDTWLARNGADPGTDKAVVIWTLERAALAAAAVPKDAPLWKFLDEIGFDNAVKVIGRVTMVDPRADPPMVRLEAIIQRGWIRGASPN